MEEHSEHKHDSQKKAHEHHGHKQKEESITITKTTLWQGISGLLGILLIVSLATGGFGFGSDNTGTGNQAAPTPTAQAPSGNNPSPIVEVSEDDDAVLGDPDAPITIIEFSDFQCPYCARFKQETLEQLKTNYIDTGKAKLIYRDFPLGSLHPRAQISAEAAECVRDQTDDETYYAYHDALFDNVQAWGSGSGSAAFVTLAGQVDSSIDGDELAKCIDSGEFRQEVQDDLAAGSAAGITGTPSFFVNGVKIVGAQPFSAFQQVIESQL